ncbi:MAG: TauD/TfdA family dioxygenase, partial [Thiolinea sp.]
MSISMPPDSLPLQHPSAWRGCELEPSEEDWCMVLSMQEIAELEHAAEQFLQLSDYDLIRISPELFPLPTLSARLETLRATLVNGWGFQVWRGLPVKNYGPEKQAVIFCGLGSYLGQACSQNAQGHLLGHVRDTSANAQDTNVRIYQTAERQTFHTDSADVVGLLCLQEAQSGGDSMLVSTVSIYNAMAETCPELLAELFKPVATDRRGEVPEGEKPYFEIPVLSWFDGQLTGMYQR